MDGMDSSFLMPKILVPPLRVTPLEFRQLAVIFDQSIVLSQKRCKINRARMIYYPERDVFSVMKPL